MSDLIELRVAGTKEDWSRLVSLIRLREANDTLQAIANEIERVVSDETHGEVKVPLLSRLSGAN